MALLSLIQSVWIDSPDLSALVDLLYDRETIPHANLLLPLRIGVLSQIVQSDRLAFVAHQGGVFMDTSQPRLPT